MVAEGAPDATSRVEKPKASDPKQGKLSRRIDYFSSLLRGSHQRYFA